MSYISEILRLYYVLGKNRNQIAKSLGLSHPTITRAIVAAEAGGGAELMK